MANTIKKHSFRTGETLRLKKLSDGRYSLTIDGNRLEDPFNSYDRAIEEYKESIKHIRIANKQDRRKSGGMFSNLKLP